MMLEPPFAAFGSTVRVRLLAAAFVGSVILGGYLTAQAKPLNSPAFPRAVLAYEFSWTGQHAAEILASWGGRLDVARTQIRVDFVFLCFYPVLFSLLCGMLAAGRFDAMSRAGVFIAWAVLACAPLDAVENVALLRMLDHQPTDGLARLAAVCASVKFALVFAAAGYVVLQGASALVARLR